MTELPGAFTEMLQEMLGDESIELIEALNREPVVSVRLNRRKPGAEFPCATPVKWCPSGLYLSNRPEFIFDPLLHAGAYYVQDASSMIYETVAERISRTLLADHPNATLKILDLCASPGGKTTAMINGLPDNSEITANEYSAKRVGALKENLAKWGFSNTTVTNRDSSFYGRGGERFDIVAVDAPCSGEGMMRKDEFARQQWSQKLTEECSLLQKEILENAIKALKPGGFLIYSTCTFNRLENEENVQFIKVTLGLKPWDPQFPKEWGIPGGISTDLPVFRFMPHKTEGEGLFLAIFRKEGEWEPSVEKFRLENKAIKKIVVKPEKGKEDLPGIEEILDFNNEKTGLPRVEVSKEAALAYLRREAIATPPGVPKGYVIVTYKNLNLGLAKNIGNRLNNLYPKNLRILKR